MYHVQLTVHNWNAIYVSFIQRIGMVNVLAVGPFTQNDWIC